MKQVIAGCGTALGSIITYGPLMGVQGVNSSFYLAMQIIPTGGSLSDLRVQLSAAPGAGNSRTFELYKNAAATGLIVTISNTDTIGSTVGTVSVAASDSVAIRSSYSGSPAAANAHWSLFFTGDTANESIILGNSGGTGLSTTLTRYCSVANSMAPTATEIDCKQIIPTPGTLKKFYWACTDPGTSPDTYRATLRKATGTGALGSTTITSDIVADNTAGNDTTHTVSVAAGDAIAMMFEPISTPSVASTANWGMVFVADIDGESMILGGSTAALSSTATQYNAVAHQGGTWNGTEYVSPLWNVINACVLKKFFVQLSGSPRGNNDNDSYTFNIRRWQGVNTGITVTISDGGTGNMVGNDSTHTYDAAAGTILSQQSVPSSSPTSRDAYWGLVCFIAPPVVITPPVGSLSLAGAASLNDRGITIPTEVDV